MDYNAKQQELLEILRNLATTIHKINGPRTQMRSIPFFIK